MISAGERAQFASGQSELSHSGVYSRARDCNEAVEFLFWVWGQDLQQRKRETFLRYGFHRFHDANQLGAKSMYCKSDGVGGFTCLWAFGMLRALPGEGAYFFKRGDLHPWLLPAQLPPNAHMRIEDIEQARTGYVPFARLASSVRPLVSFTIQYEEWVSRRFGRELRERCFKKWKKLGRHQRFADFTSLERCLLDLQTWANLKQAQPSDASTIPLEC